MPSASPRRPARLRQLTSWAVILVVLGALGGGVHFASQRLSSREDSELPEYAATAAAPAPAAVTVEFRGADPITGTVQLDAQGFPAQIGLQATAVDPAATVLLADTGVFASRDNTTWVKLPAADTALFDSFAVLASFRTFDELVPKAARPYVDVVDHRTEGDGDARADTFVMRVRGADFARDSSQGTAQWPLLALETEVQELYDLSVTVNAQGVIVTWSSANAQSGEALVVTVAANPSFVPIPTPASYVDQETGAVVGG